MTSSVPYPSDPPLDAHRCPDCGAGLPPGGAARCPACGLPLTGPLAARLWQVVTGLHAVEVQRASLLRARGELLVQLRALRGVPDAPLGGPAVAARAGEVSGRSAQTALLVLGGVLVSIAALVFTVVSWGRMGVGGRAAVLFCLTAAALAAPLVLRWRRLFATAETFAGIGVALLLLDGFSLQYLGVGGFGAVGGSDGVAYWAGVTAVVSVVSTLYGWVLRIGVPVFAGYLLGRLPLLLAAHAAGYGSLTGSAAAMAATAAVDFGLLRLATGRLARPDRPLPQGVVNLYGAVTLAWAGLAGALALRVSLAAGLGLAPVGGEGPVRASLGAWLPLVPLALLALAVSLPKGFPGLGPAGRRTAAQAAGAAAVVAGGGTLAALLPRGWGAVGFAVPAALLAVAGAARLRRGRFDGRVVPVGLLTVAGGVLFLTSAAALAQLLPGVVEPVTHWRAAWEGTRAVPWSRSVPGAALTALGLPVAAAVALRLLGLRGSATASAEAGLWAGAAFVLALLPVALGLPHPVVVGFATGLALVGGWFLAARPPLAAGVLVAGVLALVWALADRSCTVVVLALGAALAVALTVRGRPAPAVTAALAVALLGGEAAAVAVTAGLQRPDHLLAVLGVALATAPAAALLAARTDAAVARAVEFTGYGLAALALLLSADVPGRLSFELAVTGAAALGVGLREERRRSAPAVGVGLLVAASWIWLALLDVRAPEAYSLSPAAAALVFGHLRREVFRQEGLGSWGAYGPGLAAGLLPSLWALFPDGYWLRPLLLGAAALVVTVLGVRLRLQCPLLLGGGVLVLVAGHELAPTVVQVLGLLPRWVPLAAAGALLLALGATYEQRLRDARRLHGALRRLG
ncbi:SCO7613 C-terminal domain-containing membrane protein [Kitasatospora sp. NPDC101183]|uniref:SCO7613 C-terminal domain-containing membrane protein n=1 Tax=Kitasatospora sp. NPDC101183 TaxID=3364100 RepID=UPI0037F60CDD